MMDQITDLVVYRFRIDCSRCGGHGLRMGMDGAPLGCSDCGEAGVIWPPRCWSCGRFGRKDEVCQRCSERVR